MRRRELDSSVDVDPVADHDVDDRPGQLARSGIGLDLGQVPFQDRARRSLSEVGLEDGGEGGPAAGAQGADAIARAARFGVHDSLHAGPGASAPSGRRMLLGRRMVLGRLT